MYATASARSDGLLLLCGGRDADATPLGDAYGLARHRDGRWEWAAAPGPDHTCPISLPPWLVPIRELLSYVAVSVSLTVSQTRRNRSQARNKIWLVMPYVVLANLHVLSVAGDAQVDGILTLQSCAAGLIPSARYQHSAVFTGARLHVSGGAVGGGKIVEEATSVVVLDTHAGTWVTSSPKGSSPEEWTRRCVPPIPANSMHITGEVPPS